MRTPLFAGGVERFQKNGLKCDGNSRVLPSRRSFQRFGDFRPAEFPCRSFGDDIAPHRRQRLAGVEWPLDDHSLRSGPSDDFVDGPRPQFRAVARSLKRSFRSRSPGGVHLPLGGFSLGHPGRPFFQDILCTTAQTIGSRGKLCRNIVDQGSLVEPRAEARARRRAVAGSGGVRRDTSAIADRNGPSSLSPCVLSSCVRDFHGSCSFGGNGA